MTAKRDRLTQDNDNISRSSEPESVSPSASSRPQRGKTLDAIWEQLSDQPSDPNLSRSAGRRRGMEKIWDKIDL